MFNFAFAMYVEITKDCSKKNIDKVSKALSIIAFLLSVGYVLILSLNTPTWLKIIYTLVLIVILLLIGTISDKQWKDSRPQRIAEYKEHCLKKLKNELADSEKYDLGNEAGLDWLISCCDSRLKENHDKQSIIRPKQTIQNFFVPLVTLIIASNSVLNFTKDSLYIVLLLVFLYTMFYSINLANELRLLNDEKKNLSSFKEDLEYIKLTYLSEKT